MKRFYLLLCVAYTSLAYGQPNYCGTDMPEHMLTWLDNYKSQNSANKQRQLTSIKFIPLKIHLVATDDGVGFHKIQYILDGLCTLNEQYAHVGFYFYLYGDIDYINSTSLYNHTGDYSTVITNSTDPAAANIFYVNNADGNCGYYSGWGDFIVIAKSCAGPSNSTVAHELGHYFSLPHTFRGWENRADTEAPKASDERVNGSNCNTAGDRFCDTPADYVSGRWSCPYRGTKLDYNGDPYNVDGTLFMSYANDGCQNKFSPEQIDVIHAYLSNQRGEFLNLPVPKFDSVGTSQAIYPPNNSGQIPANFAQIKWRKVPGATRYHLQVSRYATIVNVDTIVQDTSVILANLESSYNYKWRVRPFNEGYTCAGYTTYSIFTTRPATPIIPSYVISGISCSGEANGSISVGVSGGTQPYDFDWSTGASGQLLTNLLPGNYVLTISESGPDSVIVSFDIGAPDALVTEISQSGYQLGATVTGGTPPFIYHWSNGSSAPQNTVNSAGDYSVTVTDSRGCSVTKSFFFTGITALDLADTRIYPNPVNSGELLKLDISVNENFKATLSILDNTGRKVIAIDKSFSPGLSKEILSLPSLTKGIYFLRITGEGVNFTRKLVVI